MILREGGGGLPHPHPSPVPPAIAVPCRYDQEERGPVRRPIHNKLDTSPPPPFIAQLGFTYTTDDFLYFCKHKFKGNLQRLLNIPPANTYSLQLSGQLQFLADVQNRKNLCELWHGGAKFGDLNNPARLSK